ncbi:MAG: OmpA family protein [Desulfobulbaceae bacterium]|nr:OmpA family protein [Desulfobulbaceae bacterium]
MTSKKVNKKLQNDHEKMRQSLKRIKRNGSFFNATEMMTQAKKQIQKIILIGGTCFMLTSPAFGLEIRQDFYNYPLVINTPVEIPIHQTFIIARQPSFYARPESRRPERRSFSVVFFDLGSAWLSPEASKKLLMELRECCVACPLYITGYTCSIGIESQNLELSRSRAEVVATMLRRNGYQVASAEGKGMIYGSILESNRKVEIKLAKY